MIRATYLFIAAFTAAALSLRPALGENLADIVALASPGEVIEVAAGIHYGPVVIDRSLTLRALPGAIIDGQRKGSVITITAPDVRIEGFVIRNSGLSLQKDEAGIQVLADRVVITGNRIESCLHGIYLKKVNGGSIADNDIIGATRIEAPQASDVLSQGSPKVDGSEWCSVGQLDANRRGNGIHLWNSQGVTVTGNTIRKVRDGLYFSFTDNSAVRNNTVTDCRYGLHYMYSDENAFVGNLFTRNAAGAALMYSKQLQVESNHFTGNRGMRAYGLLLQSVEQSRFIANQIEGNTIGLYAENSLNNRFAYNNLHRNYVGLRLGGSSWDNVFGGNSFARNTHSVEITGDSSDNHWSIDSRGNHWPGVPQPDLNGDGVAELPHREADLLGDLRTRFPTAGLLSGSTGLELLRFAVGRHGLPGVRPVEDPFPLTHEP